MNGLMNPIVKNMMRKFIRQVGLGGTAVKIMGMVHFPMVVGTKQQGEDEKPYE